MLSAAQGGSDHDRCRHIGQDVSHDQLTDRGTNASHNQLQIAFLDAEHFEARPSPWASNW
ncbi:MAG: hypothetical protein AAFN76_02400 [Pseudomonadota bacterium]